MDHAYLKKFLQKVLAPYAVPSRFIRLDNFIYTTSGKCDRKRMLNEYATNSVNILESDESTEIEEKVTRIIKSALPAELVDNISSDTSFDDLGISSINFIQIIVVCEEEFNIVFDEAMISPVFFNRVANLIFYIAEK